MNNTFTVTEVFLNDLKPGDEYQNFDNKFVIITSITKCDEEITIHWNDGEEYTNKNAIFLVKQLVQDQELYTREEADKIAKAFLDDIREHENESGTSVGKDERTTEELYTIFVADENTEYLFKTNKTIPSTISINTNMLEALKQLSIDLYPINNETWYKPIRERLIATIANAEKELNKTK